MDDLPDLCGEIGIRHTQALGQTEQAAAAVDEALAMAASEGASRAFIDEGEPLLDLLRTAIRTTGINHLPSEIVTFVAALLGSRLEEGQQQARSMGNAILSLRECDVLAELANGRSNKEIARKLDLTENTVKFHLRSVYDKLGVGCRVLAVSVAREKGVLAS